MTPMSEEVNVDINNENSALNSEATESIEDEIIALDKEENELTEDPKTLNNESGEILKEKPNVESLEQPDCIETSQTSDSKDTGIQNFTGSQDSHEEENPPLSSDENKRQSSVENRDRQSSVESKSHPSTWSFSQWSENNESLDEERPIEDFNGDPQKLILWAAEKNELETMRKLLEEDPTLVNAKDNDLYTPLHRASYSNHIEVIKMLLSYDADIHSKTADGWQALHCACKWDSVEAVSLLLQNGADVNAKTKGNITPLHLAASNVSGRRTLELLLWQPYIDPNVRNDGGDTAYDIACRTGPLGALFEILEESVNVY